MDHNGRPPRSQPPMLPGLPLIGSMFDFKSNRLAFLQRAVMSHEDMVAFRLGRLGAVLLNDAALINQVLMSTGQSISYNRPGGEGTLSRLFGAGMLYRDGASQRQYRKKIGSLFQHRAVGRHASTVAALADEAQRRWRDGSTIELYRELTDLTFDIFTRTLLAADAQDLSEIRDGIQFVYEQLILDNTRLLRPPAWLPTPRRARFEQKLHRLRAAIERLIHEARGSAANDDDLLSMLVRYQDDQGVRLTTPQIRDDLIVFLLAGHETTSVSLCWAFYLLMLHPDTYRRLQEELLHVLKGRAPELNDLRSLELNLKIVKEALRLYPVSIIKRWATQDVSFRDYWVPSNTLILICPYLLHRRSKYFVDPDQFKPDRFNAEAERSLPCSAYIPFGDGPRACIGSQFALLESQIILATLAQNVTFELTPGQRVEPDGNSISLRPVNGIRARVRRRDISAAGDAPSLQAR